MRNRAEKKAKREALIARYKQELHAILLLPSEAPEKWLNRGDTYHKACKLVAERELYAEIRGKGGETK